jgi:hypothetical protein
LPKERAANTSKEEEVTPPLFALASFVDFILINDERRK